MARLEVAAGDGDLLERSRETAVIRAAIDAAVIGSGRVVVVEGEAGIGKTQIVGLACALAHDAGMRVLQARGGPLERQFPFGVARQLFEMPLARADQQERATLLAGAAAGAAATLRDVAPPQQDPGAELMRALHGLYWLCSNLTDRGPLLLAIDDAHWSDCESLHWLSYMATRAADLSLLLIVATRAGETPADAAALASIAPAPGVDLLRLAPLTERSSALLVRAIRGPDTADEFCRACHAAAAGNPFYVRELSLETQQQSIAAVAIAAPRVARLGPRTVAMATTARLAALPGPCAVLARAVAVLGLDVDLRTAAALAAIDMQAAERAADALTVAGVLHAARPLNFKHPVVAAAIYTDMTPGERSLAHARAADILSDHGADPGRVGSHLLAVEPATDPVVSERLRAAAADALRRGAPATAVSYLRRALAETGDADSRIDVGFELGRVMVTAGEPEAIEHLGAVIDADPDPDMLIQAVVLISSALQFANRVSEALELVRRTIDQLARTSTPHDSLRLAALHMQLGSVDPAYTDEITAQLRSLIARAWQAGPSGSPLLIAAALATATRGESPAAVRSLVEGGLPRGRPMPQPIADSPLPSWALISLIAVDELDAADSLLELIIADARTRGSVHAYASALMHSGWIMLRRGNVPAAETDERAALELASQQDLALVLPWARILHAGALIEQGNIPAAAQLVDELVRPENEMAPLAGVLLEARGRVRIAQGRYAEGAADLRRAGQAHESIAAHNPNILHWRSSLALALGRESSEACALAERELELARELGYPRAIGVALRVRGLLAPAKEGLAMLIEAAAILRDSPARLEHARTLFHLGAALRRDGQRAAARAPLRDALDLADRLGAEALAANTTVELSAAGGRPRRRQLTGAASLTPTERRIADLAAAGASNKDIAQALFVSLKTVEMHLGRTYRKLGIHSRAQLPVALSVSLQ
jgi:DNA-binding CsgD family transcriptional regulator